MKYKKLTVSIPEMGLIVGVGRNAAYEAARKGEITETSQVAEWVEEIIREPVTVTLGTLGDERSAQSTEAS